MGSKKSKFENEDSVKQDMEIKNYIKYNETNAFLNVFKRENIKKILVIGEMGTGKSALCSKMIGAKLLHKEYESESSESESEENCLLESRVDKPQILLELAKEENALYGKQPFKSAYCTKSITQEMSFVISNFLGREDLPEVMVIDSPGFFDPQTFNKRKNDYYETNNDFFFDLVQKLKGLETIDVIVVMLKLGNGGRLEQSLIKTIEAINYMFKKTPRALSQNLFFVYSKCDMGKENDYRHINGSEKRRKKQYNKIFRTLVDNGVDMGIQFLENLFCLSAVDPDLKRVSQEAEFLRFCELVKKAPPIETKNIVSPNGYLESKFFLDIIQFFADS